MNTSVTKRQPDKGASLKVEPKAGKSVVPKEESKIHYEYFDSGNHWCRTCNLVSTNIFDVFSHLHSKQHQMVRGLVCRYNLVSFLRQQSLTSAGRCSLMISCTHFCQAVGPNYEVNNVSAVCAKEKYI